MTETTRRRRLLQALGGAGALALAGCSAGGFGDSTADGSDGTGTATGERTTSADLEAYCAGEAPDDATAPLTVTVGPDGSPVFDPQTVELAPGQTLRWEWDSEDHNVRVEDQTDEASWSGTAGDEDDTYDAGHTYEHTFDVPGRYEYYCRRHVDDDAVAEIRVEADDARSE